MSYITKKLRAASERGRRMALKRWETDRKMRDLLAAADPVKFSGSIVRRIIVVDYERTAKEAVIFDFDSAREARRKQKAVLV